MESESEVIEISSDQNGNLMMKIVIENRGSRWVSSFAISTVAARWPIPGDGMKTSSVCFITNQRLLQREKNIGCVEGFVVGWGWTCYKRPFNSLGGRGTDVIALLVQSIFFYLSFLYDLWLAFIEARGNNWWFQDFCHFSIKQTIKYMIHFPSRKGPNR